MDERRALITGVSGFVGGFLAEHLLEHGWEVLGTSPGGLWDMWSPPHVVDKVPLVDWDFAEAGGVNAAAVAEIRRFRPSAIFHLAAISVPEQCGQGEPTATAWQINVQGTRKVLELAEDLGRDIPVLVVSSSHVYGTVTENTCVVDEARPLAPHTAYGKTKEAAEQVAGEFASRGQPVVIARAFHHSGPRQKPPMLLPHWAKQFADPSTQEMVVYSLEVAIDLSDVRDVVRAYRLLIEGRHRGVFNVGSGRAVWTREIYDLMVQISGRPLPVRETRQGRRHEPIANVDKLVRATGWQPLVPLKQTVADVLNWWKEHGPEYLRRGS